MKRAILAVVAPMGTLPPVVPGSPAPEPLQVVRHGSVVSYTEVDSYGVPIGTVDYGAVVPANGQVRYVIVSNPSFGIGNYVAIPAGSTQFAGGRVVAAGSAANWQQAPRHRGDEVQQIFGTLGTVN